MRPGHLLQRLSEICLALPEATREDMGDHAAFAVRKKKFGKETADHFLGHKQGVVDSAYFAREQEDLDRAVDWLGSHLGLSNLFLTVYSSIFLQNRGLRNHRGGVAPGAVSPPEAYGSTC